MAEQPEKDLAPALPRTAMTNMRFSFKYLAAALFVLTVHCGDDTPFIPPIPAETDVEPRIIYALYSLVERSNQWEIYGSGDRRFTSTDGLTWERETLDEDRYFTGVEYFADTYWATGPKGTVFMSEDGLSWTQLSETDLGLTDFDSWLSGLALCQNQLWAYGSDGTLLSTADGTTWTSTTVGSATTFLTGLACDDTNSIWVATALAGEVYRSTDGSAWSSVTSGVSASFNFIEFDGTNFLAGGNQGTLISSSDGNTWSELDTGTTADLYALAAQNDNEWLLSGEGGLVLTSTDGSEWVRRDSGAFYELYLAGFAGDQWIVAGEDRLILASPDGELWELRQQR